MKTSSLLPAEDLREDALGEQLRIGDIVAHSANATSQMQFGKIIAFTKKGVKLLNFTVDPHPDERWGSNIPTEVNKKASQVLLVRQNNSYKDLPAAMTQALFPNNQ
jgi:hypothetical protein